jgi:sulfur carrier protein
MTMEIRLNGEAHMLPEGGSIADLIRSLELAGKALAVAVNRQVVPRGQWEQRALQASDQVDIVRAIGGG